jgi:hypothetical protein
VRRMSLGPETDMSRRYVAAVYAQMALEGWSKAFEAEEPAEDLRQPLLSLCAFYGIEVFSRAPLADIWAELRPELERSALPVEAGRELHPEEAEAIDTARAKVASLPIPVGVRATPDGTYTSPHVDAEGWPRQICAAFGTRSEALAQTFIEELKRLSSRHGQVDDGKVNAALASPRVENVIAVAKVTRAFGEHAQTLARLQGRIKREPQAIHVEKHEHHHHHEHRGTGEMESQPHVTTAKSDRISGSLESPAHRQLEVSAEVWSEDARGSVVPLPGREGEAEVLPPRRRRWFGSSEG